LLPNAAHVESHKELRLEIYGDDQLYAGNPHPLGPEVVEKFLKIAYTKIANDDFDASAWNGYLRRPVNAFDEIAAGGWVMDVKYLVDTMPPMQDEVPSKEKQREMFKKNRVFNALLSAVAPYESLVAKNAEPENIDEYTLFEAATDEQRDTCARFALLVQNEAEPAEAAIMLAKAQAWWGRMQQARDAATPLLRLDAYRPSDSRIIEKWYRNAMARPLPFELSLDVDETPAQKAEREAMMRMHEYASRDNDRIAKLIELVTTFVKNTQSTASSKGLFAAATNTYSAMDYKTVINLESTAVEQARIIQESVSIGIEIRRMWGTGLVELCNMLQNTATANTFSWWLRGRATSWSERVRMLDPMRRLDAEWPDLLDRLSTKLNTDIRVSAVSKVRSSPLEVVFLSAAVDRAWKKYTENVRRTDENADVDTKYLASELVRGVLAPLDDDSLTNTQTLYAKYKLSWLEADVATKVFSDDAAGKKLMKFEQITDNNLEPVAEESVAAIELFATKFQNPVVRFGGRVLGDDDIAKDVVLGAPLATSTITWLSRFVNFIKAERDVAGRMGVERAKEYVSRARALKAGDDAGLLLFEWLRHNSMLYGNLNSGIPSVIMTHDEFMANLGIIEDVEMKDATVAAAK
jgi:hypothetical protein